LTFKIKTSRLGEPWRSVEVFFGLANDLLESFL